MCDGPIPVRVNVWRHFQTSESVMWIYLKWNSKEHLWSQTWQRFFANPPVETIPVRNPAPNQLNFRFASRLSTNCNFSKHRSGTNCEYVCGRRIIFGLWNTVPTRNLWVEQKNLQSQNQRGHVLYFVYALVLLTRTFGELRKCLAFASKIKGDELCRLVLKRVNVWPAPYRTSKCVMSPTLYE